MTRPPNSARLGIGRRSSPPTPTSQDVSPSRDYWILTPYGHDPRHAKLADGTDPADLVATGAQTSSLPRSRTPHRSATNLVDERFAHLPPHEAAIEALRVIAATPPERWETGTQDIAERLGLPASLLRTALHDLVNAWNHDPRGTAQHASATAPKSKTRLAHADAAGVHHHHPTRSPPDPSRQPPTDTCPRPWRRPVEDS